MFLINFTLIIYVYAYLPDTGSKLIILFIRSTDKTTSSNSATLPLEMPVLPACGHTAMLLSLQYFNMSDTSFAVFGLNTSPLSPAHTHTSIKHNIIMMIIMKIIIRRTTVTTTVYIVNRYIYGIPNIVRKTIVKYTNNILRCI